MVKSLPANAGAEGDSGLIPGLGRSTGGGKELIPVFLPGKFHGQRSLVGYSPKSWLQRIGHDRATEHPRTVKVRSEVLNH